MVYLIHFCEVAASPPPLVGLLKCRMEANLVELHSIYVGLYEGMGLKDGCLGAD